MYYYHRNIGDEVSLTHDDSVKCVINDFKKSGADLYNYLVSKETYDSIKEEGYSYLVSINSYDDLSRIENSDEVLSLGIYEIGEVDYYEKRLQYETNIYFIIGAVILLLLIGVVIFFNTKGYILANTKKTKKKDNTLLLTVCSTILTIVNGYVTGSLIALILILLTEL